MIDFLINYEHKVRELESVCLIKIELERRGYTVELLSTYDNARLRSNQHRKAKVILTSALYNNDSLYGFVYSIAGFCRKVVNLHWEQVLSNREESDPEFYQNPKEYALEALHLCWGVEPRKRLLKCGVSGDRTVVVGPLHIDFLRPLFEDFYLNKKQIASQYGLDSKNDWILFISSFSYTNLTDEQYESLFRFFGTYAHDFQCLSNCSKQKIIEWLEKAIKKYPDKTFIYRPHPSENDDKNLQEMEVKYQNFHVINELSVNQWIKCCDKILNWYSTSVAEVFFAGKKCSILRPVPIPFPMDISIYRNAHMITDVNAFLEDIGHDNGSFPLIKELIQDYYNVKGEIPSYIRLCDLLEIVIKSDHYDMKRHKKFIFFHTNIRKFRNRILFILKEILVETNYTKLFLKNSYLIKKMENHIAVMARVQRDHTKNKASDKEIIEVCSKIQRILNAVHPS